MNRWTGTKRAYGLSSVFVLAVLAACSGNTGEAFTDGGVDTGTAPPSEDTGVPPVFDASNATPDVGVETPDVGVIVDTGTTTDGGGGGGMCTPTCTSDSDCQSTCPSAPGAINCCDVSSGVCFTSASATCPDVGSGTGTGGTDSGTGTAY